MRLGLALSGGGLRSATFALGVVQALANARALRSVDVLSTVSGGGYTGALINRLFQREADGVDVNVEEAILPEGRRASERQSGCNGRTIRPGSTLRWLRENGNHLAPSGGGDLLVGGAVILRNWVSVHVVLFAFFVAAFALLQILRDLLHRLAETTSLPTLEAVSEGHASLVADQIWWSPWFGLVAAMAFASAVAGAVYWTRWRSEGRGLVCNALQDHRSGRRRSVVLKYLLLGFAAALGVALLDGFGQAAYVLLFTEGWKTAVWVLAPWLGFAALAQGGRRLAVSGVPIQNGRSPRLWRRLVVGGLALLVFAYWTGAASFVSHAIAWGFDAPNKVIGCLGDARWWEYSLDTPQRSLGWSLGAFLVLAVISAFFGRAHRFLNDSTLQPLYRARLVRAFLGAANPERVEPPFKRVTRVIAGDDTLVEWEAIRHREGGCPYAKYPKGAPLHLVNVTVNETVQRKSWLQRNDRRGIGMAVGPAGLSAGVRHHVVFRPNCGQNEGAEEACGEKGAISKVYPEDPRTFRMFEYTENGSGSSAYHGEPLTLGQWVGISGAAFSTGIGWRTSVALSFLTGFANVRLGYWWNSGVTARMRTKAAERAGIAAMGPSLGAWFSRVFPVQSHLLDEFFARFHGVARERWNLSDGGHFENLGAYELIRRRVPLIVVVDAEADPDYGFEGLGQLVRKARADFDAEISFLDYETICARRAQCTSGPWEHVGTLDMLRRGRWESGVPPCGDDEGQGPPPVFAGTERKRHSSAHAAVATVTYEGRSSAESVIVYVKPTLLGDEPADIRHYHEAHPDFPQQTTADQFFDEAQWESYRALGEWIGSRLLVGSGPLEAFADLLSDRAEQAT